MNASWTPSARLGRLLRAAFLAVAFALPATAEQWYVDVHATGCADANGTAGAPFCDIQRAIDVAADGDTIHIARGAYAETLVIDKDLTLIGTDGDALTVVNAQGKPGNGVLIEDGAVVSITGLTVRNANRAGIRIESSVPPSLVALTNSTVNGNRGGGIFNRDGTLLVTGSTLRNNSAYDGGGIFNLSGDVTVMSSSITGNLASSIVMPFGGGIYSNGTLTVTDSTINGNSALSTGRSFHEVYGGGVYNGANGVAALFNTTVSGNSATIPNFYLAGYTGGGGIFSGGQLTVEGCVLADNTNDPSYIGEARVIDCPTGTLSLSNSTVAGTYTSKSSSVAVRATPGSVIANTIAWGNAVPLSANSQISGAGGLPTVQHSDVQGGWTGPGGFNLAVDPQFTDAANGDYSLSGSSGLIDQGDPATMKSGLDLAGGSRMNDGDLNRSLVVDMGAYEFSNVNLAIGGQPIPGGELVVDVTGKPGMTVLMVVGLPASGHTVKAFGNLFFSLALPQVIVSLGTIPSTTMHAIPTEIVGPLTLVTQVLALDSPGPGGRRPGNVSNPVSLTIE